jgi:hypothetical protein
MNTRTTLLLVLILAAVGGFVWWDHHKGTTTEERETKSKRIVEFDPADVTGLDLVRSNQTIGLVKSGNNWEIKQPLAVRADAGAVNAILDALEFAERQRTIGEQELKGVNLADYGLDAPRYRVTLHSKKRPVALLFGRETPTKEALYVRVEGRKDVFVTRKSIEEQLNVSLEDLRSRVALEFLPAAATRIEIKLTDRIVELAKSAAEPRWTIARPLAARADQTKVAEWLNDLSALRIQDFISEDPKDLHGAQLDEPEREVSVFVGDAGQTLLFGKTLTNDTAKIYAKLKSGNSIFTVSAEAARKLSVQLNDLRDARVLAFKPADVQGIEISRNGEKLALSRAANGWRLTAPLALPADDPSVARFLGELGELHAKQFVADVATDLDRYGLATPALTVTLLGDGTNVLAQLLAGGADPSNGVRYAKSATEPFIYGVELPAIDKIPANYAAFRSRRVFDLKPDQITKLEVGPVTVARAAQGKWQLVAPTQGALDTDSVNHLVELLSELRAESFGRAMTDGDAALGTTIRVTVGDATHWLSIASDRQAAADSCELTFELAPAVVQTLTKPLVATPPPAGAP